MKRIKPRTHVVVLPVGVLLPVDPSSVSVTLLHQLSLVAAKAVQAEIDAGNAAPCSRAGLVDRDGQFETIAAFEGYRVAEKGGAA